jgi:formate dehydrogenase major subunit
VVWTFPDPVPMHREPLYTNRRDLVESTRPTRTASPSIGCRPAMRRSRRTTSPRTIPIILTSGRLVEYEGGGDETRSNPWLAELQQDMFVEINPRDANNPASGTAARSGSKGPEAAR